MSDGGTDIGLGKMLAIIIGIAILFLMALFIYNNFQNFIAFFKGLG